MHAASLTDDALTLELGRLAVRDREATAALIVHLAEFDARRLYEGAGYPSMFAYCRAVLRLSEDAAYNRIKAARATRMYPAIVAMLADGALNPTSVRLLAPHLTAENHAVLLAEAAGMGKEDVLRLLARWFPQPDVAASVRKVPSQVVSTSSADCEVVAAPPAPLALLGLTPASPCSPVLTPPKPPLIRPLAPERYEVRFTADAETRALLKEAQDLLGHAVPTGDIATVFHRALTVLVSDLKRRKFGMTSRPRSARSSSPASGDVPGRGAAGGLGARCKPLRVRLQAWPPLRRDALPGVPPRRAARGRRCRHRRQHPASVSCPQRSRGRSVLRAGEALDEGSGQRTRLRHPFWNGCASTSGRVRGWRPMTRRGSRRACARRRAARDRGAAIRGARPRRPRDRRGPGA